MKIDIVANKLTWENEQILNEIKKRKYNNSFCDSEYIDTRKISYLYEKNKLKIFYKNKEYKIPDILLCRGGFTKSIEMEGIMFLKFLEQNDVFILDSIKAIIDAKYKSNTLVMLSNNNINFPKSIFINSEKDLELIDFSPVVIKPLRGQKGKGIYKVDKLEEIPEGELLIQEYIECNYQDLRVHVIGNKVIGSMKRIAKKGEWRSNIALGGNSEFCKITEEQKKIAINATKACGLDIAGVDIITDKNNVNYILEVNRAPQFKGFMELTKINYPKYLVNYLIEKYEDFKN